MKRTVIFLFILFLMFICFHEADAKQIMELKIGRGEAIVSQLDGSAQYLPAGKTIWMSLKERDIIKGGYEVRTGPKSRLELIMPDNSAVRFADGSHFKILQIEAGDESRPRDIKVHMAVGKSWANLNRAAGKPGRFELTCPTAVAGVRGTIYRMNVEQDKSALIRVYDGQVEVTGGGKGEERTPALVPPQKISGPKPIPGPTKVSMEEWTFIIKSMQQIKIAADGSAEKPRDFTVQEDRDDWVDWNKGRDSELK